MDSMDIAALSMDMSAMRLQMNVGTSVAKKAMDQQEIQAQGLMEMMPSDPNLGRLIDTQA